MRIRTPEPASSEITPQAVYLRRREFIRDGALALGTAAVVGSGLLWLIGQGPPPDAPPDAPADQPPIPVEARPVTPPGVYDTDEPQTSFKAATTYNNFYEFGVDKDEPADNAHTLQTRPWTISIEGEVAEPRVIDIDTLLSWLTLEDRVYRIRRVEAR